MNASSEKATHFGEHLTIDGYRGSYEKLNNKEFVEKCLTELPQRVGMHAISEPLVKHADDNGIKDPGGWSGLVMIAESHISVHTFPARGFVSIDVYTCKNGMDTDTIKAFFQEMFELEEMEVNFIKRGTRYPQDNIYN
jgi:S-adenosylmethionine decarboxylase